MAEGSAPQEAGQFGAGHAAAVGAALGPALGVASLGLLGRPGVLGAGARPAVGRSGFAAATGRGLGLAEADEEQEFAGMGGGNGGGGGGGGMSGVGTGPGEDMGGGMLAKGGLISEKHKKGRGKPVKKTLHEGEYVMTRKAVRRFSPILFRLMNQAAR